MVQYGTETNHLEHPGDHGPEIIQNSIADDNPGPFKRHPPRVGLPGFPLEDALQKVSGNFPIREKWMRKFTQP